MSDYDRIAKAIEFINVNLHCQPSLDEIAAYLNLSSFHFQRLFSRWAGVTPKKYLQILTVERAKLLLNDSISLLEVSDKVGLSSGSRLYDHFVQLEAVTPGEFKKDGENLLIEYALHDSPFGKVFVAITSRGICKLSFIEFASVEQQLLELSTKWPFAIIKSNNKKTQKIISTLFNNDLNSKQPLSLHVSGTNFQVNVWKALLRIPQGAVVSYSQIAAAIGKPTATRAVGTAIGANPAAIIIPCHRVIQQSGKLGGYFWGETRKHAIHVWETARIK